MKRKYQVTLAVVAFFGVVGWWWLGSNRPLTPSELADRALTAASSKDRIDALAELQAIPTREAIDQLRRVGAASKDPDVVTTTISALTIRFDAQSTPLFLANMDNESAPVRQAAFSGTLKVMGLPPENYKFQANGPVEQRAEVVKSLRDELEKRKKSGAAMSAASPTKGDPDAKTTANPNNVGSAPSASDSQAAPALSSAAALPAPAAEENPAFNLLTWMCRILAVLVLLADVAGAMGLLLGEGNKPNRAKETVIMGKHQIAAKHQPTVAQEINEALAKNTAGLWSKVAILVGGAVTVVALLTLAEMIQLAVSVQQTAVRVEYYLSRK